MTGMYNMSLFGDTETAEVAAMHDKFGFDIAEEPQLTELWEERLEKMREELDEFEDACKSGDLAGAADALVDLGVFLKGTVVMMGLPWRVLWDDVMRANVSKERGIKPERPDHTQDLIKPEGWEGPKTEEILNRFRQP